MSHITLSHGLILTRHGVFQAPGMRRLSRSAHLHVRLERSNNLLTAEQTSRAMERQLQRAKDGVDRNASTATAPTPSEQYASIFGSCIHITCEQWMCGVLSALYASRSLSCIRLTCLLFCRTTDDGLGARQQEARDWISAWRVSSHTVCTLQCV